ncbi:MAG TPA: AMP-binding protein, partial [Variovorax sp.]|nr:AMP-binding protein [Variovorax sp.]
MNPSHAKGATDVALIEATLGDFFDAMVAARPDHEALVSRHEGLRFTYRALHDDANRLASALLRLGLAPGERVGIWSHNNAAWVMLQIATAKVGLVLVNINPAYRTSEVEYALNKVGCAALVTMARFKTSDYLGMLRELAPELDATDADADAEGATRLRAARLPTLRHVVWIDGADARDDVPGMRRFSRLLAGGDAHDPRVAEVQRTLRADEPVNIQFTSGTTGFPKG